MRLTSDVQVRALLRQITNLGGFAAVIAKGDPDRGEILIVALEKGVFSSLWQRVLQVDGTYQWTEQGAQGIENKRQIGDLLLKRKSSDPDLWVIELDIPQGAQLAVLLANLG